ncbi:MAG: tetratricopeptide repeat protein [Alphaproteobacteria bacterium]|nr:tetratricopeptide repeat protein [Alphaproteobacteria bacterium]
MTDSHALYAAAVRDHRDGRLGAAAAKYREILSETPGHADSLHMLGVIASASGEPQEAFELFGKAVSASPSNAQFLNNLGVSARATERLDAALAAFRAAVDTDPELLDAQYNLGNTLLDMGQGEAAVAQYRCVLDQDPANIPAQCGLANAVRFCGDLPEAEKIYESLIAVNDGDPVFHNNLGVVKMEQGKFEKALIHYQKALKIDQNYLESLNNIANILLSQGNTEAAERALHRVLARDPKMVAAHGNLGNALRRQGRYDEAAASYREALTIRSEPGLRIRLATLLPVIADSQDAMTQARQKMERAVDELLGADIRIDDPINEVGITQFHLSYHDTDNRVLSCKIARLYEKACPSLRYVAADLRRNRSSERLKVGFVSQHFRDHAVGWCYHGLLRLLPSDRITVSAFTFGDDADTDALWRSVAKDVDNAVILPKNLSAARQRIGQEALDVLIYTDIGMEPLTYFLAFARLAPVQCVTNGHPDTTGIPAVDYFISNAPLEAPGADASYSERLEALDDVLVHYDRPPVPDPMPSRAAFGLPEDATLYMCPQSLFKIHPDMDLALLRILSGDSSGRLVIVAGPEAHWGDILLQRWQGIFGDLIDRVQVLERQPFTDFLGLLRLADVLLDTWPFCGGNTAYQGLAMGTPIVTFPGRFARGRSTMALYNRLEMPELVADSPESYAATALRLGTDRAWRSEISTKIQTRSDRLFGDRAAVDAFARFLLAVGDTGVGEGA